MSTMDTGADDADSHKEREPMIREWQEKTKKVREPRVKMEKIQKAIQKEQPAVGRKTVNHVLVDPFDPRSDDEDLPDEWSQDQPKYTNSSPSFLQFPYIPYLLTPNPRVKIETGNTVPWSSTSSRSFTDPALASTSTNITKGTPDNRGKTRNEGRSQHKNFSPGETYRSPPGTDRFNFNPAPTGSHTYMTGISHTRQGSGSAYTGDDIDLGSPKAKAKPKKVLTPRHDTYRPRYPTSPPNAYTSFWAGHPEDSELPPYSSTSASLLAPYSSPDAPGDIGSSGVASGDVTTASGYIGYNSTHGENEGVFGNYGGVESYERETKKARVAKKVRVAKKGDEDAREEFLNLLREQAENRNSGAKDEDAKDVDNHMEDDVEMGGK
ncbi:hypothetical protein NHQ30_008768 [Ciborinia camelliae]|nr:hypothetical protein NHQ30_008768 [Ciborinia camelliae]